MEIGNHVSPFCIQALTNTPNFCSCRWERWKEEEDQSKRQAHQDEWLQLG